MDGVLHGVLVWGVATLVTFIMLSTGVGRLMSGLSTIMDRILSMTGQAVGTTAKVAGNAVQTTASATGSAIGYAADKATDAAGNVASAGQTAVDKVTPSEHEMRQLTQEYDMLKSEIREEVKSLMRDADMTPEQYEQRISTLGQNLKEEAKDILKDPTNADTYIQRGIDRVLGAADDITNNVERDNLVQVLAVRTGLSEEDARRAMSNWENRVRTARKKVEDMHKQAEQQAKINRVGAEAAVNVAQSYAQDKASQMQNTMEDAKQQARQMQHQASVKAREVAQDTTEAVAKLAFAVFASLLVGLGAAGFGGFLGTPESLPEVDVTMTETSAIVVDSNALGTE